MAAAAAESPRKRLQDEATCSICLDFFRDPVTLDCGHNFCRACIEKSWSDEARNTARATAACPQCRERVQQRSLKPNRLLANMVEIAKELKPEQGWGEVCEWHQEPLKLFCRDDEAPICLVCNVSKEHRAHNVVPLQEAAQEYKDQICSSLETLTKEREKILACKAETEKESQALLEQMEAEREKTVVQFQQLRQFLEEEEKLLLAQMDELKEEIARKRDEHLAKISEKLSSVEGTMQEMEEKRQQSVSELLQDIRSTLKRCEKNKFKNPVAFPPALKWRIWDFCDINPFLEGFLKRFQDTLISGLQLKKANVSFDPNAVNAELVLSEDHKEVREAPTYQYSYLHNPERFYGMPFVLGREGFTAGRHFWEVVVESPDDWSVGVARKSMRREDVITCGPEEGIWDMGKQNGEFRASNHSGPLSVTGELKRIYVTLNYDGGRLTFHDADTAALVFAYSAAPFSGENMLPFFSVTYGGLTLSP